MGEMQDSAPQERRTKGWSRWDIMALGADRTLIPSIGDTLSTVADNDEEIEVAHALSFWRVIPEFDLSEDETIWYEKQIEATTNALEWLAKNANRIYALRNGYGFSPLKALGEAMIYFGENTIGFPGQGCYEENNENDGYLLWKNDNIKYGTIFRDQNTEELDEAFAWLAIWFRDLWD